MGKTQVDRYEAQTDGIEIVRSANTGYSNIQFSGKIVYENSSVASEKLTALVERNSYYVLDIDGLHKIDSTGLGVLVSFAKKVKNSGGDIAFVVQQEFLRNIFKIAKFDYIFPVATTKEEAWQALDKGYSRQMELDSY